MAVENLGSVTRPVAVPAPMLPVVARVRKYRRETHDTFTLTIDRPAGPGDGSSTLSPGFAPGQFNMLYVFGVGEVPISHSGSPSRDGELVHTIRGVGSVTGALSRMRRGATLGVRGPFGSSWPLERARGRDVVVVAGGIGLAPLRPVVYELLRQRDAYRRIALLYGARSPADLLYVSELDRWRARPDFQVQITVDRSDESWHGHVGVVTQRVPYAEFDPAEALVLACGPEVMMRFVLREFRQRGVPEDRIFLSLERNMQCAIGQCGHCQLGPHFICKDGPVFRYDRVRGFFELREA